MSANDFSDIGGLWMLWFLLFAFWVGCGIQAYALVLGGLQHGYPTLAKQDFYLDRRTAIFAGMFGLAGFIAAYLIDKEPAMYVWRNPHEAKQ